MKGETVKVVVEMPKPIHSLITKLAAVEGSSADEWYVDMITHDIAAYLDNAHDVFDVERLVKSNGLQDLVKVP